MISTSLLRAVVSPLSCSIFSHPGRDEVIMMRREKIERKKLRRQEGWTEIGSSTVIDQGGGKSCEICIPEGEGQQVPFYWAHPVASAGTDAQTNGKFTPHSFQPNHKGVSRRDYFLFAF